jgi:nitrogen fixation protein FixH
VGIGLTLLVFIAGMAGLVVMACVQRTDLVSASYYEDEVLYQQQIDRAERARRLESKASVTYDTAARRIILALPPEHARVLTQGRVRVSRPSEAGLDRRMDLQIDSGGVQAIEAASLKAGLWKVEVNWTVGGEDYYLDRRVVVGVNRS